MAIWVRVSASLAPACTFGQIGSSGFRDSAITAQLCAMASVLSQASGRSANKARIIGAGLNQCSGVTRRRSFSDNMRLSAMQSRASCASYIAGLAKKQSLVATNGMPRASASPIRPGSIAASNFRPWRCSSITVWLGNASAMRASSASAASFWPSASSRAMGPKVPPVSRNNPSACAARTSNESCARRVGSDSRNPSDERRCRLARPAALRASSAMGSGLRRELSSRVNMIWQPMIG